MSKAVILKSKHLFIAPCSDNELREMICRETDMELLKRYGTMLTNCRVDRSRRLWHAPWKLRLITAPDTVIGHICFNGPPQDGAVEFDYRAADDPTSAAYLTEALQVVIHQWVFAQEQVCLIHARPAPGDAEFTASLNELGFRHKAGRAGKSALRREKSRRAWLSVYLCLGIGIGAAWGYMLHQLGLGVCIGMASGITLSVLLDNYEEKRRVEEAAKGALDFEDTRCEW